MAFEDSTLIGLLPAGGRRCSTRPWTRASGRATEVIAICEDDDTVRPRGLTVSSWMRLPSRRPGRRPRGPERTSCWAGTGALRPSSGELDHYVRPGSEVTVVATSRGVQAAEQ